MAVKTTTKKPTTTKVEVLLSIYWYKDKPISVVGIKNENTKVGHDIPKTSIPGDGWFGIATHVKIMSGILDETRVGLINNILSEDLEVKFPVRAAIELPNSAELKHTIVKKHIEV